MTTLSASFLGVDCPGVVAAITVLLGESGCNIEAMTQSMLCGEFTAVFIVRAPEGMTPPALQEFLTAGLVRMGVNLSVIVRHAVGSQWGANLKCEPFVVTVDGPDGPGLIGAMSKVFARHGVNIEKLTAVLEEMHDGNAIFVFEVMVPSSVDIGRLRRELNHEAKKINLRVSTQHRSIFEAVNRVKAF